MSGDFLFHYGRDVLGPVFTAFLRQVEERAKDVDRVFFLEPEDGPLREMHAVLTGRVTTSRSSATARLDLAPAAGAAAFRGISEGLLRARMPELEADGLKSIAHRLGMAPDQFITALPGLGLERVDQALRMEDCADWPCRLVAHQDLQRIVRQGAQTARRALRGSLEQAGFFGRGRRVALIAVGWDGSLQRDLRDAFCEEPDWPEVSGYYMSLNDPHARLDPGEAEGILFDARRMHPDCNVFEHFKPLFEIGPGALRDGAISHARESPQSGLSHALEIARRAVFRPTADEATQLLDALGLSAHRMRSPLLQAIMHSPWKYGTARGASIPGLTRALRLAHLLRIRGLL